MPKKTHPLPWAMLLAISYVPFLLTASPSDEPDVSAADVQRLSHLPLGIADQEFLTVRSKQVDGVKFYGATGPSRAGYARKAGTLPQSLWLILQGDGSAKWASATVKFIRPLNLTRYNSLVLWVRSRDAGTRMSVSFQDTRWRKIEAPQGRTDSFPRGGFPRREAVQVVVPFASVFSDKPVDFRSINSLSFEFGEDTAGNLKRGTIEVLAISFVVQVNEVSGIKILPSSSGAKRVAQEIPKKKSAPKKPVAKKSSPAPAPVEQKPAAEELAEASKPALKPKRAPEPISAPEPVPPKTSLWWLLMTWSVLPALILLVAYGVWRTLQYRAGLKSHADARKVFQEVKWNLPGGSGADVLMARSFWTSWKDQNVSFGWLSPFHALDKSAEQDEYYGESFLREQIQWAKSVGVEIFPSLCFARTVFHYETFLMNPALYGTRQVAQSERQLSDEELRIKYIGHFPVWIPPYWQRQHALPQRLMVAYGKLPGLMASNDSVQFNLTSPDLRAFAIRVLERFAKVANGVRIEGAAALLNSSINRHWLGTLPKPLTAGVDEFWDAVITAVKAKYPDFIFVADHVGSEAKMMRKIGFDYVENDQLREIMINQIRLESVGPLRTALEAETSETWRHSIYNILPLLKSGANVTTAARQQNLLCAVTLSLLPGVIETDEESRDAVHEFLQLVSRTPALRTGDFALFNASDPAVLSFGRWEGKNLNIVIANFAMSKKDVTIRFEPLSGSLDDKKLYLFSDLLHGASFLKALPAESSVEPATAVLGQDLRDSGLRLPMPALSVRLFSLNLTRAIPRAQLQQIRQFHKT